MIVVLFLTLTAYFTYAEDGHNLWLRGKSTASVNILCKATSPTLEIAKRELKQGWQGKEGTTIILSVKNDKAIKNDGFKLTQTEIQANNDFGGFWVKANSEGQSGPQDYGRTHVDGANVLADALKPFGGIVMWRAFVYNTFNEDRVKQVYNEFMPLDGQFHDNVIIQVKNGPIDFQLCEPFSPLFGAMKRTSIMPEVRITQEYMNAFGFWGSDVGRIFEK